MKENVKSKRINEYNIIRAIAVILVVIGHCTYYKISTNYGGINFDLDMQNVSSIGKFFYNIFVQISFILYTFHMPLFFALSGALFKHSLDNGKYKNIKELIIKKSQRLLIPFFIVALIYSVPIKYLSGYYNQSKNIFKDIFVGQILQQGNTHLWFLPTLFFIFVASYIYIYIQRSRIQRFRILNDKYILFILLIFINVFSVFVKIELVKNILFYLIYFYIGYCFESKREQINYKIDNFSKKKILYLCLIIGIVILNIFVYKINHNVRIYIKTIKRFARVILAIEEIVGIYIIAYKLSKNDKIIRNNKINKIGEYSFGIYLYSDPLNYALLAIVGNNFNQYMNTTFGIIALYFIRIFVTFYVAALITYILKKFKIKYIC